MKKKLTAILIALLILSTPVVALFGVGDIVHDPISYANALVMLGELVKSYEELEAQSELELKMAKTLPFDMLRRYRVPSARWSQFGLPYDRFGNLGPWLEAVNSVGNPFSAYYGSSVDLFPYGPSFSKLPAGEQKKLMSQYATTELADGVNIRSIETLGQLQSAAEITETSLQMLEMDSLSRDPALNTEIGVLNKINAASLAAVRTSRDTNRALMSVLSQGIVESKVRRDAEAAEINAQIMRLEFAPLVYSQHVSTITQTLESFRWR